MTEGREGSSGPGGGSGDKPRRPQPPILDLKPTRVSVEPAAAQAATAQAKTAGEPGATSQASELRPAPEAGSMRDEAPTPTGSGEPTAVGGERKGSSGPSSPAAERTAGVKVADGSGSKTDDANKGPGSTDIPRPPAEAGGQPWRIAGFALAAGAGAAAGVLALLVIASLLGVPLGADARLDQSIERIDVLESRVRDLAARPLPTPDDRVDGLLKRVAAGERALQRVTALEARIDAVETQLKQAGTGTDPQAVARVEAVEATTKTLAASVAELRRRLDEVGKQASGVFGAAVHDIDDLTKRVASLETAAKDMRAALAKAGAPDRDRAARLAAAALALRSGVESGAGFAPALAAVRALAPDDARLAALEPFAANGIPSLPVLRQEFAAAIPKAQPKPESRAGDGWLDRLQSGFTRLVRIRPADEAAPSRGAFAPVDAALARGDLEAALVAVAVLPEPTRAPLDAWIKKAQGRVAALKAARELLQESLAALTAPEKETARP
jgi:hypothetical protein